MLYRAFFEKTGQAIYISHLDLQRAVMRAIRKAGLPAQYSQGFNPHLYVTFALPLPLGQEGARESFDFKAEENSFQPDIALVALNEALPTAVRVLSILPAREKPTSITKARYEIAYTGSGNLKKAVDGYADLEKASVFRTNKKKQQVEINLKSHLAELTLTATNKGEFLQVTLPAGSQGNVNPDLLVGFLCDTFELLSEDFQIRRVAILTESDEVFA